MTARLLHCLLLALACLLPEALCLAQSRPTTRTKARAGAYSRYDRSGRRDEENLKLAPGMRLNMPSPPTTDYMGRPLKKKPAKQPAGPSTISSEVRKPAARRP